MEVYAPKQGLVVRVLPTPMAAVGRLNEAARFGRLFKVGRTAFSIYEDVVHLTLAGKDQGLKAFGSF